MATFKLDWRNTSDTRGVMLSILNLIRGIQSLRKFFVSAIHFHTSSHFVASFLLASFFVASLIQQYNRIKLALGDYTGYPVNTTATTAFYILSPQPLRTDPYPVQCVYSATPVNCLFYLPSAVRSSVRQFALHIAQGH